MSLSPQDIEEFQAAYRQSFHEEISFNEAKMMANELVLFLHDLLVEPVSAHPPFQDLSTGKAFDFMSPVSD